MRQFTTTTAPAQFIGSYGQNWNAGLLSEHVASFVAAGGTVRGAASGSGAAWAVVDGVAYPVVCSEIVEVHTEDGPMSGRCGARATVDGLCAHHEAIVATWDAAAWA